MIERDQAFAALVEQVTEEEEVVVTGIASQTVSRLNAKHRPKDLYLRVPMGLTPATGPGVPLAHPDQKVIVIEGDGSMLMGLTSLTAVAHCQPKSLMIICMDNGVYEDGGKMSTVNVGRTDFVKTAQGLGIPLVRSLDVLGSLREAIREFLAKEECSFLHVFIGLRRGPVNAPKLRPFEMKYQFLAAIKGDGQEK